MYLNIFAFLNQLDDVMKTIEDDNVTKTISLIESNEDMQYKDAYEFFLRSTSNPILIDYLKSKGG